MLDILIILNSLLNNDTELDKEVIKEDQVFSEAVEWAWLLDDFDKLIIELNNIK